MVASLDRLRRLDDGLVVLPGHGMTTSIGRDDLIKFLAATGHPPRLVAVCGAGGQPED